MDDIPLGLSEDAYTVHDSLFEGWLTLEQIVDESGLEYPRARAALNELEDWIQHQKSDKGEFWAKLPIR